MSNASDSDVSPLQPEAAIVLIVAAFALSVLTVVSNGLLIYVVIRTSALHTCTNFFIASLSAGELLTGTFVIPFAAATAISGGWAFPSGLCIFVGFMGMLGPCASAFSLLVVSADRCVAVSKPLRYATLVTKKSAVVIITVVWTLSMLISVLPVVKWGRYFYSGRFKMCLMRSSPNIATRVSEVVVKDILIVFIPVGIVILIAIKTVHHIRGHRRVFVFVPVPVAVTSLPTGMDNANTSRSRVKATRTLLLVMMVFIVFSMPVAVADILCQRPSACRVTPSVLRTLLWLSFLSCFLHPNMIMLMNRKFRMTLRLLFCRSRCIPRQPSMGDRDPFTISSGLQAVLEASLLVNAMHGSGCLDTSLRRHVVKALQSRAPEDSQLALRERAGLMTLRKTRSSPDCRFVQVAREGL